MVATTTNPAALTAAEQQFVKDNLGLAGNLCRRYARQGVLSYSELFSEGCLALCRCAKSRPENVKASTYCVPAIERQLWGAIEKARNNSLPQEPPVRAAGDGAHLQPLDSIPARPSLERSSEPRDPADYLAVLNEVEKMVVRWRYGLHNGRRLRVKAVAQKMRYPVGHVLAILREAVGKMRAAAQTVAPQPDAADEAGLRGDLDGLWSAPSSAAASRRTASRMTPAADVRR